jgi:hypothetical protein
MCLKIVDIPSGAQMKTPCAASTGRLFIEKIRLAWRVRQANHNHALRLLQNAAG